MPTNPWRNLPRLPAYVLPEDKLAVEVFNRDATEKGRLHVDTPPEPFLGPLDAPIVLLFLNPGVAKDGKYDDDLAEAIRTSDKQTRHFYIGRGGNRWWDRLVRPLSDARPGIDLGSSILSIEFFPYRSVSFACSLVRLPSQEFSFSLVRAAVKRNAAIILARGERHWAGAVPELKTECSTFLKMRNPQMASLSEKNLGPAGYRTLLEALDRPPAS